jgi:hypothetical protein
LRKVGLAYAMKLISSGTFRDEEIFKSIFKYKNNMSEEIRIEDATSAQAAARRHLEALYGADRVLNVKFSRTWYATGSKRDVWEVEGDITIKKGLFGKEVKHFKFQIDPESGRVIAFEG